MAQNAQIGPACPTFWFSFVSVLRVVLGLLELFQPLDCVKASSIGKGRNASVHLLHIEKSNTVVLYPNQLCVEKDDSSFFFR